MAAACIVNDRMELRARGMTLPAMSGQASMVDYQFVCVHSVMYSLPMLYALPGNMICIAAALPALQEYCGRQDVLVK